MSKRISLCWEMGSGIGHLTGLLQLADRLVPRLPCDFHIPDATRIDKH